jgi:glycosyltransferase involved in cell wall biosynthesis
VPRVAVMPVDDAGVGNYRLRFPAEALAAAGEDVMVDSVGPRMMWDRRWVGDSPPEDARIVGVETVPDADVVVFQRPTVLYRLDAIRHLRAAGVTVVVDVDDRLDRVHRLHAAKKGFHRATANHQILDWCCAEADLVTCSTPALLARYGHGHGVVLPNLVPASYLNVFGLKRPGTVGWSGFVGSHPTDLQQTGGAVEQVLRNSEDWGFHVVGDGVGVREALGLSAEPTVSGPVEFVDYPAVLTELEVGIVPLESSAFNDCKSYLKLLEMSALGVPAVASPTPENLRLHRMGAGLIAESRGQWRRLLGRLMSDAVYRYELAEKGRSVAATLCYEDHCGRWLEAWTSAVREPATV